MKPLHFGQVDHGVGSVLVVVGDHSGLMDTDNHVSRVSLHCV